MSQVSKPEFEKTERPTLYITPNLKIEMTKTLRMRLREVTLFLMFEFSYRYILV